MRAGLDERPVSLCGRSQRRRARLAVIRTTFHKRSFVRFARHVDFSCGSFAPFRREADSLPLFPY
jgi:hypothetical protein